MGNCCDSREHNIQEAARPPDKRAAGDRPTSYTGTVPEKHSLKSQIAFTSNMKNHKQLKLASGIIVKQDFLKTIKPVADLVRETIIREREKMIEERQNAFIKAQYDEYREIIRQQLNWIIDLHFIGPEKALQSFKISPQIYRSSLNAYQEDYQVISKQSKALMHRLEHIKKSPHALSTELHGICEYMPAIYKQYHKLFGKIVTIDDYLLYRAFEADTIHLKFGYNEFEVLNGMLKFNYAARDNFQKAKKVHNKVSMDLIYKYPKLINNIPRDGYGVYSLAFIYKWGTIEQTSISENSLS